MPKQKEKTSASEPFVVVVIFLFMTMAFGAWMFVRSTPGSIAALDVPQMIQFQGKLTNDQRITVPDSALNMKFVIYDAASGGTCLWSAANTDANTATVDCGTPGAISVTPSDGVFSVLLGNTAGSTQNALPDSLFDDNVTLYLGVTVGADAEMSPRIRLGAVPYALQAGDADLLDSFTSTQVGAASSVLVTESDSDLALAAAVNIVDATTNRTDTAALIDIDSESTDGGDRLIEILSDVNVNDTLHFYVDATGMVASRGVEDSPRFTLMDGTNADTVSLYVGDGSTGLDGTLSAQAGSLFLDEDGKLWVNVDGASDWAELASSATLTLQNAYGNGNTISTTDARNLSVTLADTSTDANFLINLACATCSASGGLFAIQDEATSFFVVNPDRSIDLTTNQTTTDFVDVAADTITTANGIDLSADGLTTGSALYVENIDAGTLTSANVASFVQSVNATTDTVSGGVLAITRSADAVSGANTLSGDIMTITQNALATTGGTWSSTPYSLLHLVQSDATRGESALEIDTALDNASAVVGIDIAKTGSGAGTVMQITNAGTGNAIIVDQNGATGTGTLTDTSGAAVVIGNTGSTGRALGVYSNNGATQSTPLVSIFVDNAAFDEAALTITNDGANRSLDLVQNGNARSLNIAALSTTNDTFGITSNSSTSGDVINSTANVLTTGNFIDFSTTTNARTSSDIILLSHTASNTGTDTISGSMLDVTQTLTNTTASSTLSLTGAFANLTRSNTSNNASATVNVTGPVISVVNNGTQTLGTLTDSGHLMTLTQNYASATGNGIFIDDNAAASIALNIDSEATTVNVAQFDGSVLTTGSILSLVGGNFTDDSGRALAIDVTESTETADLMTIQSDYSSSNNNVFRIEADGEVFSDVGFTAGAFSTNYLDGSIVHTSGSDFTFTPGGATDDLVISTSNLKVGANTPDVALNGEDMHVSGTFEVDGATRFDGTVAFNGGITYNTDVDLTFDSASSNTENFTITHTHGTDVSVSPFVINYTNSAAADTNLTYLMDLTNQNDGGATGTPDGLLLLRHLDSNETVADGINFAVGSPGILTDAVDATDTAIVNAFHAGDNFLLFNTIQAAELSSGTLTWEDTSGNDLMTLVDNGSNGNVSITNDLTVSGDIAVNGGSINASAGLSITPSGAGVDLTLNPTDDLFLTAGDDLLTTFAAGGQMILDAATNDSTITGINDGVIRMTVDADPASSATNQGFYMDYETLDDANANQVFRALSIDFLNSSEDAADLTQAVAIVNADNASGTAVPVDVLLRLNNADATAASVADAINIASSGVDNGVTDAIDASTANINNAINMGNNFALFDGIRAAELSTGTLTFEDTSGNDLMAIVDLGTGGSVAASANFLAGPGFGFDTNAAGAMTFGNTNATSISVCNSAACDTLDVATNTDADTINFGDTTGADVFTFSSGSTSGPYTFLADSVTTGPGVLISSDGRTTAGAALSVRSTSPAQTGGFNIFSDHVATYTSNASSSAKLMQLTRSLTADGAATTLALAATADVVSLSSDMAVANGGTATDASNILQIIQNFASATGAAIDVSNSGTGSGLYIDQNGNTGSTVSDTAGGALHISNTGNTDYGLTVYSNTNAAGSSQPLTYFFADNANFDQTVALIQNDGTGTAFEIDDNNTATNHLAFQLFFADNNLASGGAGGTGAGAFRLFAEDNALAMTGDTAARRAAIVRIETNSESTDTFNFLAMNSDLDATVAQDAEWRVDSTGATFADGAYSAAGADYAEYFRTDDTTLAPGELVSINIGKEETIRRSSGVDDATLFGVVSAKAGFIGNNADGLSVAELAVRDPKAKLVAMIGQVPINVNTENGPIVIGDLITSSSTPGVGMKANPGDVTVGMAMEAYGGAGMGQVTVLISPNVPRTTAQNTISQVASSNLTSLDMEGDIFMHGNAMREVGELLGLNDLWSVNADGVFTTKKSYDVAIDSYQGEIVTAHTVVALEHKITLSGTATLTNGSATIAFEDVDAAFNDVTSTTEAVRVFVTLRGPANGVYVETSDHNGFTVRETQGGGSNAAFDWFVEAYRKDYEPVEDIVEEEVLVEDAPEETGEAPGGEEPVPEEEPAASEPESEPELVVEPQEEPAMEPIAIESEPAPDEPSEGEPIVMEEPVEAPTL